MCHRRHAAQRSQDVRQRAHPAESPCGGRVLWAHSLQLIAELLRNLCQTASQQRFHHHRLYAGLLEFVVEILRVGVFLPTAIAQRGMSPVYVVQLNLHEIPVVFVVVVDEPVEDLHVSVIGETEVANAACLALADEEVKQSVVDEARAEVVHAATTDGVHQVVVDVVHLQTLERALVHLLRFLEALYVPALVRHLRCDIVRLAWVAFQGDARHVLRVSIGRSRVEVVHTVLNSIVHHLVHLLLASGQAHHTEA